MGSRIWRRLGYALAVLLLAVAGFAFWPQGAIADEAEPPAEEQVILDEEAQPAEPEEVVVQEEPAEVAAPEEPAVEPEEQPVAAPEAADEGLATEEVAPEHPATATEEPEEAVLEPMGGLPPIQSNTQWYYTTVNPYYPTNADQCTWYAWARASEILGRPLSSGSCGGGGSFWTKVPSSFQRGQTPKVGAIACSGTSSKGHVAIVESVNSNGSITVSEMWGDRHDGIIHTMTYANGAAWANGSGEGNFQGYIYLETDSNAPTISNVVISDSTFTSYTVSCTVSDDQGVSRVVFPTWTIEGGQDDLVWHEGTINGNTASCTIYFSDHNNKADCAYATHIYAYDGAGNQGVAHLPGTVVVGWNMSGGNGPVIPDGDYVIAQSSTLDSSAHYYLDIKGHDVPAANNTNVQLFCTEAELTQLPSDDVWTVTYLGNSYYSIKQKGTNASLTVLNSGLASGVNVLAYDYNGSSSQQWSISENGAGYRVQAKCNGHSLDLRSGVAIGTNIQMNAAGPGPGQQWAFIPVNCSISQATISGPGNRSYTGSAIKPKPTLTMGGMTLQEGTDYTLSYKNNTNVGTATVTITGKGSYTGSTSVTFKITRANVANATVAKVADQPYTGSAIKPSPKVTMGGRTLVKGTDYTLSYSNNTKAGTATITITGKGNYTGTKSVTFKITNAKAPSVTYRTHVQKDGWQGWRKDGATSGTSGRSLRLEGINIKLSNAPYPGGIQYRTHVQSIGWQGWRSNGAMAGTSGQALRLEAIQIKLTGEMAEHYDVYYRVHAQHFGWMGWAKNGQSAGTAGYGYRLEAIQIKLVPKGAAAPGPTGGRYHEARVRYTTHVQRVGWQGARFDGETSGTSGQSLRLEGIKISLPTHTYSGSIQYRTHVQSIGWQGWARDGQLSGTSGRALRLEAIQVKLTGDMAAHYDVYYRVHAQHYGWMGWAKNGQSAGTEGYGYRLEAIQIKLVAKGGSAPGSTANAFRKKPRIASREEALNYVNSYRPIEGMRPGPVTSGPMATLGNAVYTVHRKVSGDTPHPVYTECSDCGTYYYVHRFNDMGTHTSTHFWWRVYPDGRIWDELGERWVKQ